MKKIEIAGGKPLSGNLKIQGAKNSVLPILAGAMLNAGKTVIHNCPDLSDVHSAFKILRNLGCDVYFSDNTVTVNSENINCSVIPSNLMRETRSSVMFLGSIISRCDEACISAPGGCNIGERPIDLHIKAFRELGIDITETDEYIYCKLTGEVLGGDITLSFPSVGATENIMLLTAKSNNVTTISNAAMEPEIIDLQNFLNAMGANISGAGTDTITIHGVERFKKDIEYTVIPDRIAAATYLCAVAGTGGKITLENVIPEHIDTVISILRKMGCQVLQYDDRVTLISGGKLKAIAGIETLPYPGFPTDAQAPIMAAFCKTKGTAIFIENLFEGRFKHIAELKKMGADIVQFKNTAAVSGVKRLRGAEVIATDLRCGAALVIAGLMAKGKTTVLSAEYIDRGYESMVEDLRSLGARIL